MWIRWLDYAWYELAQIKNFFKPSSALRCFVRYGGETKSDHQMSLMRTVLKASSNEPFFGTIWWKPQTFQKASVSHH